MFDALWNLNCYVSAPQILLVFAHSLSVQEVDVIIPGKTL